MLLETCQECWPLNTVKHITTHQLSEDLKAWKDIDSSLLTTSGIGYYNTTFDYPFASSSGSNAAGIDFGAIFHTIRASVNGHVLPPLDPTWAKADVSEYLVEGKNAVEAVVTTPLLNTLRPLWGKLMSSGNGTITDIADQPSQDYGLLSAGRVVPFAKSRGSVAPATGVASSISPLGNCLVWSILAILLFEFW
jgi:hypothetical protein